MSLLQSQARSAQRIYAALAEDAAECTDWTTFDTTVEIEAEIEESNFPAWLLYIIAAVGVTLALFNLLVGYKYWKQSCFLVCGYICGVVTYTLTMNYGDELGENKTYAAYGLGAAAWLIGGLILAKFTKLVSFFAGAGLGVLAALFLQPLFLAYIWADHPNVIMYVLMAMFGLIGAFFVVKNERTVVILGCTFFGAFLFIASLSAFVGNMPSLGDNDWQVLAHEGIKCVPPYAWGYAGGTVALVLIGLIVQFGYTAKGIDHGKSKKEVPAGGEGLIINEQQAPITYA